MVSFCWAKADGRALTAYTFAPHLCGQFLVDFGSLGGLVGVELRLCPSAAAESPEKAAV